MFDWGLTAEQVKVEQAAVWTRNFAALLEYTANNMAIVTLPSDQ